MALKPKWSGAFELKVHISRLPKTWGTLELYRRFCSIGNLVRIEVKESSSGRDLHAWVNFRPAPTTNSTILNGFTIRTSNGNLHSI